MCLFLSLKLISRTCCRIVSIYPCTFHFILVNRIHVPIATAMQQQLASLTSINQSQNSVDLIKFDFGRKRSAVKKIRAKKKFDPSMYYDNNNKSDAEKRVNYYRCNLLKFRRTQSMIVECQLSTNLISIFSRHKILIGIMKCSRMNPFDSWSKFKNCLHSLL